jgi:hypothetical protein
MFSYKRLWCIRNGEDWEGREEKTPFSLEKSLKNLEKNMKKKRVSDTKGFGQQNHVDLKCSWKKNLGIEWEGRGGNSKQGRRGGESLIC